MYPKWRSSSTLAALARTRGAAEHAHRRRSDRTRHGLCPARAATSAREGTPIGPQCRHRSLLSGDARVHRLAPPADPLAAVQAEAHTPVAEEQRQAARALRAQVDAFQGLVVVSGESLPGTQPREGAQALGARIRVVPGMEITQRGASSR